jgi:chromate transporter
MANEEASALEVDESRAAERSPPVEPSPGAAALFFSFLRAGATAFGGPAMVPYIGELATRRKRWLSKEEFAEGVALCQSIPGATAMQTAAFVGLRAAGVRGAAAAYVGFGLPAVILMVVASAAYGHAVSLAPVQATFRGFRAMIVALVANAALRFARANFRSISDVLVAAACALALYAKASPVVVIAAAILLEVVLRRHAPSTSSAGTSRSWPPGIRRTVLALVAAALAVLVLLLVFAPRLGTLAAICLKVDMLAFGGGFASVPLMFREMVGRSWLDARAFMDGIALGQVTPGPIVVTATFVGYQIAGLSGAAVATIGIFFPSFVMVVAAAPWFGALRARSWYRPALHGALLSFVGLLVFVTFQFATALSWSVGTAALATAALVALLAGVDVLWIVVASGSVAALLL